MEASSEVLVGVKESSLMLGVEVVLSGIKLVSGGSSFPIILHS